MQLVGEIPSIPAAACASKSSTTRSAITSRSPAVRRASAASSSGERPSIEPLVEALGRGGELLAAPAALLGAEVVERGGARDLAEPGARRAAGGVEAVPEPQRPLERLADEVLGDEPVAGEPRRGSRRRRRGASRRPARRCSHRPYAAVDRQRHNPRSRGMSQVRRLRPVAGSAVQRACRLAHLLELVRRRGPRRLRGPRGRRDRPWKAGWARNAPRPSPSSPSRMFACRSRFEPSGVGAVVDVQGAQPVEPDRLVDLGDERGRRRPDR